VAKDLVNKIDEIPHFANKSFLILGSGVTGRALQSILGAAGLKFAVIDESDENSGALLEAELSAGVDFAIVSPGWRKDHPYIGQLRQRAVEIMSEIDFAWLVKEHVAPDQIWVAITGTNGKTTTVQMLEAILRTAGISAVAAGNVGKTVIESVLEGYEVLALELSSFQIDWSNQARFRISAVLNIAPDHLDWHGSLDAYIAAKMKLLDLSQIGLFNESDGNITRFLERSKKFPASDGRSSLIPIHLATPAKGEIGLVEGLIVDRAFVESPDQGEELADLSMLESTLRTHQINIVAAAAMAKYLGADEGAIMQALSRFKVDRHRMEFVGQFRGVKWINDSKATNPHAALAALSAFESVIWIAGGLAKGAPFDELVRAAHTKIEAAILIGQDASLIKSELVRVKPQLKIIECDSQLRGEPLMRQVVGFATALASAGQTVLLAPACASMDQFSSYSERGELFSRLAVEMAGAR
jgi:UDP-N-acetylmuramoylalanine--D-glutamate ligase